MPDKIVLKTDDHTECIHINAYTENEGKDSPRY